MPSSSPGSCGEVGRVTIGGKLLRLAAVASVPLLVGGPAAAAEPRVHTIVMQNMRFGPVPANLRAGDTIVWVNRDIVPHTATARDRSFDVDLPPRRSARMVVRRAGSIAFYCRYHPAMRGSLVAVR
jgi:plastocyanin